MQHPNRKIHWNQDWDRHTFRYRSLKDEVRERDGDRCQYCLGYGNTLDHVVPVERDGGNILENMVLSCLACNQLKADMRVVEFVMTYVVEPSSFTGQCPYTILHRIEQQTGRSVWRDADTRWLRQWLRKEGWRGTDAERDGIDM